MDQTTGWMSYKLFSWWKKKMQLVCVTMKKKNHRTSKCWVENAKNPTMGPGQYKKKHLNLFCHFNHPHFLITIIHVLMFRYFIICPYFSNFVRGWLLLVGIGQRYHMSVYGQETGAKFESIAETNHSYIIHYSVGEPRIGSCVPVWGILCIDSS
jgi:hypothetical protein